MPHSPTNRTFDFVHECADCGLLNRLSRPVATTNICCSRCGNILRQVRNYSFDHRLAWSTAAVFFYLLTVSAPMLQVGIYGQYRTGFMETGPIRLDNQGYWILSAVIFLTTIIVPAIKVFGTFVVLASLRLQRKPRWLARLYALLKHIGPWVMIEVYLLGFLVAYSRLQLIASVQLAVAVFGLVGLMIAMVATDATTDSEAVWESIKPRRAVDTSLPRHALVGCDICYQVSAAKILQICHRCGETLHHRKPDSLARSWALAITASILYIPSNIFPIMNITKLGKTQGYTIYGGLLELGHVGLWPLAVLVFVASIAIPVFKLIALIYMLVETQRGASYRLEQRTQLYRVIDFIGRWSMVDIFVVSILVALVHFGWLSQVTADSGAIYFASVVILTLLAVKSFDPRLMWDTGGKKPSARLTSSSPPSRVAI